MKKSVLKIISLLLVASIFSVNVYFVKHVNAGGLADIASQCFGIGAEAARIKEEMRQKAIDLAKTEARELAEQELRDLVQNAITGSVMSVPVFDLQTLEAISKAQSKIRETQENKSDEIQAKLAEGQAQDCLTAITDFALNIALARLKKQLLDRIADQTIEWINNDFKGTPRFITNFGDVFEDSYQSAIGDVARDVGLGNLCDEKLSLKLQLNLRAPTQKKFTQETQCTLDKIVQNISDFGNDFRNGGWIAYNETLSPNNNRFGLEILALDEAYKVIDEKKQEATQESLTASGFKGEKVCSEWTLNLLNENGKVVSQVVTTGFSEEFPDPQKPTTNAAGISYDTGLTQLAKQNSTNLSLLNLYTPHYSGWKCTHTYINTPGDTTKTALQSTFNQDQHYIANAENLEDYIDVVFDAAVNRLINKGVQGIVNVGKGLLAGDGIKSNSGTGRSGSPQDQGIKDSYEQNKNTNDVLGQSETGIQNQTQTGIQNQQLINLQTQYNDVETSLQNVSSSLGVVKTSLIQLNNKITLLANCERVKSSINGELCLSTKRDQNLINSHTTSINGSYLLLSTTTDAFGQINKPTTTTSQGGISTISTALNSIEENISEISQNIYNAKVFSATKIIEINALYNSCINATIYTCPSFFEE
ncbi:hypothetical protein C4565_00930 [Candidatus Parcubacteria bacterium]|jgi:hypothetical protein|nr:MAG: hypothetical protein C4565_00930 [Candidatus Parcubacteria bacterium]